MTERNGASNNHWKGGRIRRHGYIYLMAPEHPRAEKGTGYVAEHILIWEAHNGPVPDGLLIHHVNHIKDDNRIENFMLLSVKEHPGVHHMPRVCKTCGQTFEGYPTARYCLTHADQNDRDYKREWARLKVLGLTGADRYQCSVCSAFHVGHPNRKYCPDCRVEYYRAYNRQKKRRLRSRSKTAKLEDEATEHIGI